MLTMLLIIETGNVDGKLARKAKKKQTTKLRLQNFEKTFNIHCIVLKNQGLGSKHCISR